MALPHTYIPPVGIKNSGLDHLMQSHYFRGAKAGHSRKESSGFLAGWENSGILDCQACFINSWKNRTIGHLYLLRVDFCLVLSLREQFNVICPIDLLCDDPDFICNGELIERKEGRPSLKHGPIPGQSSHRGQMFLYTDTDIHIVWGLLG